MLHDQSRSRLPWTRPAFPPPFCPSQLGAFCISLDFVYLVRRELNNTKNWEVEARCFSKNWILRNFKLLAETQSNWIFWVSDLHFYIWTASLNLNFFRKLKQNKIFLFFVKNNDSRFGGKLRIARGLSILKWYMDRTVAHEGTLGPHNSELARC